MAQTIGNPLSWGARAVQKAGHEVGEAVNAMRGGRTRPRVQRITAADLRAALRDGADDFKAMRSDVITLVVVYPAIGALLAILAFSADVVHLVFPLAAGFVLLGPMAGIGLYEMSRRREADEPVGISSIFAALRPGVIGPVAGLGIVLVTIFIAWLLVAQTIYVWTLGPAGPMGLGEFYRAVIGTPEGWTMIVAGLGFGFLFAAAVLALFIVSFPMMIDRQVSVAVALATSLEVTRKNTGAVALWGVIVAALMVAGSIPFLIGLVVVLPILGHASWHLYRRAVVHVEDTER
ncbi:DUF2189 domain-containing protein [Ostreiculturibacter nitratireducens]|uniref:DUF2189 domain-containing protein n=1 Tax=Ostreiculturibacter nitratireducens TaxID=3075226 RepID=UPI0031B57A7F